MSDQIPAYRWLIAYVTLFLILALFARLRVGYVIEYYLATMVLLFILLTQYQAIATLLSPFTTTDGIGSGKS